MLLKPSVLLVSKGIHLHICLIGKKQPNLRPGHYPQPATSSPAQPGKMTGWALSKGPRGLQGGISRTTDPCCPREKELAGPVRVLRHVDAVLGWKVDKPSSGGACCLYAKPVLIRSGGKAKDGDFHEEVCQDRPQQVKVLVGTNIHPLSKPETTGASLSRAVQWMKF